MNRLIEYGRTLQGIDLNQNVSRRTALKGAGLLALAGFAAACAPSATPKAGETASPAASAAGSVDLTGKGGAIASEAPIMPVVKIGEVTMIKGIPAETSNVELAKGRFKNTIGQGTEAFLADPGGLLAGPDFGSKSAKNPFGKNDKGWDAMYESAGAIQVFSPVSQEVMRYAEPFYGVTPEGGWNIISAGQMHVKVGDDIEFDLPAQENNNYFLYIRGAYGDMKQNSDRNSGIEFTGYIPGNALYMQLESGDTGNIAFLSQGQFEQMAETSHSGGTNLGDGGASKLTIVYLDLNTRAVGVWTQTAGRHEDTNKVKLVGKNY